MSVDRINENLPISIKIQTLNDQTLELDGRVYQAQFDLHEISDLYSGSGLPRKYKRSYNLSNNTGAGAWYNWTHVRAEFGYSIWRFDGDIGYNHDQFNELYFNDLLMQYKGLAGSENITAFDYVFYYDGSSYSDKTSEAFSEAGTPFTVLSDTSDYLYIGASTTFTGFTIKFDTRGSNITLKAEYSRSGGWSELSSTLTSNEFDYTDNTSNLRRDGNVIFNAPSNWSSQTVNSQSKYWIRLSTTTDPVTTPLALLLIPANSVPSLLSLSSQQYQSESWACCDYNSKYYATFKNTGDGSVEGIKYVTSNSSQVQKQNFFRFQNSLKANFRDVMYHDSGAGLLVQRRDGTAPLQLQQLGPTNSPLLQMTGTNNIAVGSRTGSGVFVPVKFNGTNYYLHLFG